MKNTTALVASLILGILGFVAMYAILSRQPGKAVDESKTLTRILVAKKDLRAGTRLGVEHVEVKDMPAEFVSAAHVEESQRNMVLGRVLRSPVKEGDPILAPALEPFAQQAPIEIESQLGGTDRLAVSIDLDPAASVAGLLKPGQKVDVIATFDIQLKYLVPFGSKVEKGDETITRSFMLLQNRTVLAVDVRTSSRYEGDPKEATRHVVTVAVTPEEALKLSLAAEKGAIRLALRHRTDTRLSEIAPLGAEGLIQNSLPR